MTEEEIQTLQTELESTRTELERVKGELEMATGRITGFETLIAEKDAELASRASRISELETSLAESTNKVNTLNESLAQAVTAYKATIVKANPGIPSELITGDTIADINQSLENAITIVGKVKEAVKAEISSASIPAGAPVRTTPDLDALSPREKIQYAITKGGK